MMAGSKYDNQTEHDLLVLVAGSNDRQEKHLERINGSLRNHEKRLMKMEIRREIEEEIGIKPPTKKKKVIEGGMYGGFGALLVSALLALGKWLGWW